MISLLTNKDIDKSAYLHYEGMPNDFLPSFGKKFLNELHRYLLEDKRIIALKHENPKLNGVLIATIDSGSTLSHTMRSGLFVFLPYIIAKIITQPKTLKFIFETVFYKNKYKDNILAEVLVLSVSQDARKQGIGKKLVHKLKQVLREREIQKFRVSTLVSNSAANSFYQKTGGKLVYKIKIYDRIWNVYHYTLTD